MNCGYTEIVGLSKFKCSNGMLKEFPTIHHINSRHAPPIFGRIVGKCPICGGGSRVKVGFFCLEITSADYIGALNV